MAIQSQRPKRISLSWASTTALECQTRSISQRQKKYQRGLAQLQLLLKDTRTNLTLALAHWTWWTSSLLKKISQIRSSASVSKSSHLSGTNHIKRPFKNLRQKGTGRKQIYNSSWRTWQMRMRSLSLCAKWVQAGSHCNLRANWPRLASRRVRIKMKEKIFRLRVSA